MSVDQVAQPPHRSGLHVEPRSGPAPASGAIPPAIKGELPRVVILSGDATATVEALLLLVARGNPEAFDALQHRMVGLVRVNVRRVLRDASRCEAVTQETFADVLADAVHFDPDRDSAETWLLTRAHRHAIDGLDPRDGTDAPERRCADRSTPMALA